MLRQEGRTSGQGALDGTGAADETEPGKTDVDTAADVLFVIVAGDSGEVAGGAGVVPGGAGVKVVGGASVHFVQIVFIEVTTVLVMVIEVAMIVLEPKVLVSVTGHKVVVV